MKTLSPFGSALGNLEEISHGGFSGWFKLSDHADDRDAMREEALGFRDMMRRQSWTRDGYAEVDRLFGLEDGGVTVQVFLTDAGQAALRALKQGLVWNHQTQAADPERTVEAFTDCLRRGALAPDIIARTKLMVKDVVVRERILLEFAKFIMLALPADADGIYRRDPACECLT